MLQNALQSLGLYDLIVDIVPGTVLVTVTFLVLPSASEIVTLILESGIGFAAALVAVAYVFGAILESVSSTLISRGKIFQRRMRKARLAGADADRLDVKVWYELVERFDFPYSYLRPPGQDVSSSNPREREGEQEGYEEEQEVFWIAQSYLLNNDVGRLYLFQSLYAFYRSLTVLSVVSGCLLTVSAVLMFWRVYEGVIGSWLAAAAAGALSFISTYFLYKKTRTFDRAHDRNIVYSFYSNVVKGR